VIYHLIDPSLLTPARVVTLPGSGSVFHAAWREDEDAVTALLIAVRYA
jgi:hypothetical protein